jgi:hypothetical protein
MAVKIAYIDGEIPLIDLKNVKMRAFALNSRKLSPYIPRNKRHSKFNGKSSAYILSLVTLLRIELQISGLIK